MESTNVITIYDNIQSLQDLSLKDKKKKNIFNN